MRGVISLAAKLAGCLLLASCLSVTAQTSHRVWRLAEPGLGFPTGTEIDDAWEVQELDGHSGIATVATSGRISQLTVERVSDHALKEFLVNRSQPGRSWAQHPESLCKDGRFLLNDPRVGLLHNQRQSYETAVKIARLLGRTLVLPGFFKFPHPNAYDGIEWVPFGALMDWSMLHECYDDVIDLGDLLQACGQDVLDEHVTIPFYVDWMADGAPWVNGTRPHLTWAFPNGERHIRLKPAVTHPDIPLDLSEPYWLLLQPFLKPGAAEAQTIRVHGLITTYKDSPYRPDTICLLPSRYVRKQAQAHVLNWKSTFQVDQMLGMHMRIFKRGTRMAGEGPAMMTKTGEVDTEAETNCKLDGPTFAYLAAIVVWTRWRANFFPEATVLASNEHDMKTLFESTLPLGFKRVMPLMWVYPLEKYVEAVTVEECAAALRAVLFDCMICAFTDRFIGNSCSSMSQYIHRIRVSYVGHPYNYSELIGGHRWSSLILEARRYLAWQLDPTDSG